MNKHHCPNGLTEFEDEKEETYGPCRKDETPTPTCCGGCVFVLGLIGFMAILTMFLLWSNVGNPDSLTFLESLSLGIGVAGLCAVGIHLIVRGKFPLLR